MDSSLGNVTILFTDVEGSTRLWEQAPERMSVAIASHDALVCEAIEKNRGVVVKMIGDGVYAVFDAPIDALLAVVALQQELSEPKSDDGIQLRVRCGLHFGAAERRNADFFGPSVNRAARIAAAAHGGQILLSKAVMDRVLDQLPPELSFRDLGAVRLRDLGTPEHVYQLLHSQLRQDFPALRSLESAPNNLPQQVTSFVGRERELAKAKQLLGSSRILTLVGVGGIGKTRLSLQVAADVLEIYPDGVWFVELSGLTVPALVPSVVAQVLGVREEAGSTLTHALCRHVKSRHMLLMLDNCEHLLANCGELADALLRASPLLQIIVTSREPLRIDGEQHYILPTLSLPKVGDGASTVERSDAAALFVERVRLQQPDFELTEQRVPAISEVCSRLDGIPLALELAAARTNVLTVEKVAERLNDRFRLLIGGSRTAVPRQQTLRAMIDWSYDLLSEQERSLLRRLSPFVGSYALEAAEEICVDGGSIVRADIFDLTTHLVQKSLVVFDSATGRYRLLETIREYAVDRLRESGESATTHDRYREYFVALSEQAADPLVAGGKEQRMWLDRLALEHDNLRAVLKGSIENPKDGDSAARVCGSIYRFWMYRGHWGEGRDWCERASDCVQNDGSSRAKTLLGAGSLAYRMGDLAKAQVLCSRALSGCQTLGDRALEARILNNLGIIASDREETSRAQSYLQAAAEAAREVKNASLEATALVNLGRLAVDEGNILAGKPALERALAIARETDDRTLQVQILGILAPIAMQENDSVVAFALNEQALEMSIELNNQLFVAEQLRTRARIFVAQGQLESARDDFRKALQSSHELGSRFSVAECLDELLLLAIANRSYGQAVTFWGASETLRKVIATPRFPIDRERYRPALARCREKLGDEAYDTAHAAGGAMPLDTAVADALGWLALSSSED